MLPDSLDPGPVDLPPAGTLACRILLTSPRKRRKRRRPTRKKQN
jgi:hypothetical protein